VPVLLPLSSWANKRLSLHDWFIEQCALLYGLSEKLSRQWIETEMLFPLLDGLDEMNEVARPDCIAAINTYHQDHLHPLVVCSRTTEYESAAKRERFALHTAVVVQPLSQAQVNAHLVALGKPLTALRTALRKHPTLAELATTPLMLQILILTYHGTTARELSQKSTELQQHVWTAYVQRMVERKGDLQRYPLDRTQRWLSWLAQQMRNHNQTIFFFASIEPDYLPERRRSASRWLSALLGLLILEIACVSLKGLPGIFMGLALGGLASIPGAARDKELSDLREGKVSHALLDFSSYLFMGLVMGGLPFGLVFAILGNDLMLGFLAGLGAALIGGGGVALQYVLLRFWLWRMQAFPLDARRFLKDATSRVLLRRVGGGYSFTHRLLLEYFADLDTTPPSVSPGTHPTQHPSLL
jgi:hypothetical protein